MKATNNLITANIENLTSLWKTVGIRFDSYHKTSGFEYCEIKAAHWPNRLWFNQELDQKTLDLAKQKLASVSSKLIVPISNIYGKSQDEILAHNGFTKLFEQVGMSLKLDQTLKAKSDLEIRLVRNEYEARLWSDLFKKAFGYLIHFETVLNTLADINYYLAYHQEQAVGTAILYKSDNVTGIHAVGIPPEMRRKGYANQIMKSLINLGIENGSDYLTLQASDMGLNLYLKLGFEKQFTMTNYAWQLEKG